MGTGHPADSPTVTVELVNHVLHIGLNRPHKRNAFDPAMLAELAAAYGRLEDDSAAWVGVLFAHGTDFTAGLDLAQVAGPLLAGDTSYLDPPAIDPWGLTGRPRTKPIVAAAQGRCLTLGIELLLASDIRVAANNTTFAQIEVLRGIYPFGGATIRFTAQTGWGNAMRWMLTGDEFDAEEALRIGLIQESVQPGTELDRAIELAERIAQRAAPRGVSATLVSARRALIEGQQAAADALLTDVSELLRSPDAMEGLQSFLERRPAVFTGH